MDRETVIRLAIEHELRSEFGVSEFAYLDRLERFAAAVEANCVPPGWKVVPIDPTEDQWGELARDIVYWMDLDRPTPAKLFGHLKMLNVEIPAWLAEEPEMQNLDHVPSKGTRAVLIYKAMLAAAPAPKEEQ